MFVYHKGINHYSSPYIGSLDPSIPRPPQRRQPPRRHHRHVVAAAALARLPDQAVCRAATGDLGPQKTLGRQQKPTEYHE